MPRMISGTNIKEIVEAADEYEIVHDGANEMSTVNLMRTILGEFKRNMVRLHKTDDPIEKLLIESEFSHAIKSIEKLGFYLFGIKRVLQRQTISISMCTLFMTYTNSPRIVRDKKSNMIMPALLTEIIE